MHYGNFFECTGEGSVSADGSWLSWRKMGGQVGSAPAYYGSSVGSNPDISQKYKMGDIRKEWLAHSSPLKKR